MNTVHAIISRQITSRLVIKTSTTIKARVGFRLNSTKIRLIPSQGKTLVLVDHQHILFDQHQVSAIGQDQLCNAKKLDHLWTKIKKMSLEQVTGEHHHLLLQDQPVLPRLLLAIWLISGGFSQVPWWCELKIKFS